MAKLEISGVVRYADLQAPVQGARVRIYDLDTGGNGNDVIFDQRTDGSGRFEGTTAEWNDANALRMPTSLGSIELPLPDALLLQFQVDVEGRTHKGAFTHLGDRQSAPIILPWGRATLTKEQRHLIQIVTLSAAAADKALYELIEIGARAVVKGLAAPHYRSYQLLEGTNATLSELVQACQATAGLDSVRAVDLVFCTHGSTDRVTFFPHEHRSIEEVVAAFGGLEDRARKKLRMLFSTACFGATHLDGWLDVGFKVAAGSVGISADAALSMPAFLSAWSVKRPFGQAIQGANAADLVGFQDRLARDWFKARGRSEDSARVNSQRETRGDSDMTIEGVP